LILFGKASKICLNRPQLSGVHRMLQTEDYKQRLWAEIEQLSPDEIERVYKLIVLVKGEFIDMAGGDRYQTQGWQEAEQEASKAYRQGGMKAYDGVDEMMDDILSESDR